ncbi:MAG: dgoA [Proteobacteria bacterium]|nr:dgoA [Pseudomonadota bacterium]
MENTSFDNKALADRFALALKKLPLVAILRGIKPEEAEAIGLGLYQVGFRLIEVPLNSPDPFASIAAIRRSVPIDALVGAGTVLRVDNVAQLKASGGNAVFMPHADIAVIHAAKAAGLLCIPGVATPTEAFSALAAGADGLKLFPGEMVTPPVVKAIRAVLPKDTLLLPFGGITTDTMKPYVDAGAGAFGLGSALYKPGMTCAQVVERAKAFVEAWQKLQQG